LGSSVDGPRVATILVLRCIISRLDTLKKPASNGGAIYRSLAKPALLAW
jgi:hypothetical protein